MLQTGIHFLCLSHDKHYNAMQKYICSKYKMKYRNTTLYAARLDINTIMFDVVALFRCNLLDTVCLNTK